MRLGLDHMKARRFSDAGRMFEQILAQRPNDPDALHLLGMALHEQGRSEEAVELGGGQPAAYRNLGTALIRIGEITEAGAALSRAVALDAEDLEAHFALGFIHARQQAMEKAIACYRRTLELAPNHVGALSNIATLLQTLDPPADAIIHLQKLVQL